MEYKEIDLTENAALRAEMTDKTGWRTVPMIFIGDALIGGSDDLHKLDAEGKLDKMLRGEG